MSDFSDTIRFKTHGIKNALLSIQGTNDPGAKATASALKALTPQVIECLVEIGNEITEIEKRLAALEGAR